jgi:2-methylcitrate dehydratase PrpD
MLKGSLLVAATALPGVALGESVRRERTPVPSDTMATLAGYMREAQSRALPPDALEHTKRHVLDTVAAMVSGADLAPGRAALAFARAYGGAPVATVIRSNTLIGPIEAALVNAMMAHADETDDSHAPSQSHPGCSVVPAALAAAEAFHADGAALLRAVALGYDVGTRTTMALGATNFEVGNHQSSHAFAGIWGSAAAAGCLAKLSEQQLRWLLAYTADQSSGTTVWQRDTDHVQKAFLFAGVGARNGVSSALMVHAGWTGVDDVFTGSYNFFDAYAPHGDAAKLTSMLGEQYEVTRTNVKKWSVGSPIQAPLDALQAIDAKHTLDARRVRDVVVRVATEEANLVDNREMPDICLQHMVAVMLVDKTASFRSAHDKARMQDPAVLRERAKVKLVRDPSLEALLPKRVAIVEVTLDDGTKLTERVDAVRGTAQNPMTREEVVAKARDLMSPVLGASSASRLIDQLLALETLSDLRALRPLLQGAA